MMSARLRIYTARPDALPPRVVLDALGSPQWVSQATVWVCASTRLMASVLLTALGIQHSPREIRLATGDHLNEAVRAGLLAELDAVIVTPLDIGIGDPLVSVSPEGITVVGHWRRDDSVPVRRSVEPIGDLSAAPAPERS
jgi:hypothetical protein